MSITLLSLLASSAFSFRPAIEEFNTFTQVYKKTYTPEEYDTRFDIFRNNLQLIRNHNQGNASWKMAVNEFTDLTSDEFRMKYLGFKKPLNSNIPRIVADYSLENTKTLPKEWDWRTKGVVNPVKNQGQCGSCWAFSAVGALESAWAIKTGKLYSLSEQQLVDCSGSYGDQGCNGGLMDNAFQYAEKTAMCSEDSYPYIAQDGTCKKSCKGLVKVQSYVDLPVGDENALQAAVVQQPLAIAIEADQPGFQFYSGGVFDGECSQNLDHGVVLEGYGTESGKDYWLVRNSWGSSWGENGYIKLVRGKNQCGLANSASFPVIN